MILNILRAIIISLISLVNVTNMEHTSKTSAPVRLERKPQDNSLRLTNDEIEIIVMLLFVMIMITCIFFLITSCTDSGLVYNQLNNTI